MMTKEEKKILLETLQELNYAIQAIAKVTVCNHTLGVKKDNICTHCECAITKPSKDDDAGQEIS